MMTLPAGVVAPVPTPLDDHLRFDSAAQKAHLSWLASERLDGVLVLGTNGDFPSFSLAERIAVAETAAAAGDGMHLMLGVGSCALPEVMTMLDVAARCGYEAVLCPPPFYFRGATAGGLAAFFREVLDASSVPVLLYHIPQVTGVPISEKILDQLEGHERLAGVKDSSGDPDELARLCRRFRDRAYIVGSDRLVTACLAAGGRGSISAAASVAPRLVNAVHRGDTAQDELDALRGLLEDFGLGPSVKAILRRAGLGEFAARPPLVGLDPPREDELWTAYCRLVPEEHRPRTLER
jgi:4-hydroxy-tetrahydrodipicolinate synthase